MKRLPFILLCLLLPGIGVTLLAQKPVFQNFSPADGLSGSNVYRVIQDRQGYMWFATESGVSRFDGQHFENFSREDGLGDPDVLGITEDSKGRIWFMPYFGKLSYYLNGKIHHSGNDSLLAKIPVLSVVSGILEDSLGNIWVSTFRSGLLKIDSSIHRIEIPNEDISEMARINCLRTSRNNQILAATMVDILTIDQNGTVQSKPIDPTLGNGPDNRWIPDNENGFWMATGGKLLKINQEVLQEVEGPHYDGQALGIFQTVDNWFWICTTSGVWAWRKKDQEWEHMHFLENIPISSVFKDREGGLWFTSLGRGVWYAPFIMVRSFREELPGTYCHFVIQTDTNEWLVGLEENNFVWIRNMQVESASFLNEPYGDRKRVRTGFIDSKKRLWIGGDNALGMKENGRMSFYYLAGLKDIREDPEGNIWTATSSGIMKLTPEIIQLYTGIPDIKNKRTDLGGFMKSKKILFDTPIFSLLPFTADSLLVGYNEGLFTLKVKGDSIIQKRLPAFPYETRISTLEQDSQGGIWIGTLDRGAFYIKDRKISVISTKNGLPSNNVTRIRIDSEGRVWVCTTMGLVLLKWDPNEPSGWETRLFDSNAGIVSNEIRDVASSGDSIWIATSAGLTVLDLAQVREARLPPPVYLNSVQVRGKAITIQDDILLPFKDNDLSLSFVGISYQSGKNLLYRYRMQGQDSSWNYSKIPSVEYKALPWGKYVFEVEARSNSGVWSEKAASFAFTVARPYWAYWWFILLVVLAVIGLFWLIFNQRYKTIQRRIELRNNMILSEQKALRAQMNPHFIFNALNSIQRFFLRENPEDAHEYLGKFSRLMRQILENSDHSYITIEEELQALKLYLELEALRADGTFDHEILIDETIDPRIERIPGMMIQPFAENAIWHGLIPGEKKGKLIIEFRKINQAVLIMITDNGIGREKSAQNNKRKPGEHKSSGTKLVRDRIHALNQLREKPITLNIIDLQSLNDQPEGTRIELLIPIES